MPVERQLQSTSRNGYHDDKNTVIDVAGRLTLDSIDAATASSSRTEIERVKQQL